MNGDILQLFGMPSVVGMSISDASILFPDEGEEPDNEAIAGAQEVVDEIKFRQTAREAALRKLGYLDRPGC